jgi:predicted MPP superfamily phosphohydrolase
MFDKIRWLHISDLHLKSQAAAWSQDVVLRALHKAIAEQRVKRPVNFILATGDLSYSGKHDEFLQVEAFFDNLLKELDLSRADVFFIPGNHDNDLSLQKYSVVGARTVLTSAGLADELVGDAIERNQILTRQGAFWKFVSKFVPGGTWRTTPDGLGYIATKTLSPLRLSIIGLNSAWLCHSGQKDHGNVVVGERQIIEVMKAIEEERPHFVIAMIHHPLFWLCSFEHKAIEDRLRQVCDFVLRGHLHETDIQTHVTGDHRCVFAAAGASFKTRESRNSFQLCRARYRKWELHNHSF